MKINFSNGYIRTVTEEVAEEVQVTSLRIPHKSKIPSVIILMKIHNSIGLEVYECGMKNKSLEQPFLEPTYFCNYALTS